MTGVHIGDCWLWPGGRNAKGYGRLRGRDGKLFPAHRAMYEAAVGPIPDGMVIRHRCDNPACVNPFHLEVGTQADNMRDASERGQMPTGLRSGKAKLSDEAVQEVRRLWLDGGLTQGQIAERFGISASYVSRLCSGARREDAIPSDRADAPGWYVSRRGSVAHFAPEGARIYWRALCGERLLHGGVKVTPGKRFCTVCEMKSATEHPAAMREWGLEGSRYQGGAA